MKDGERELLHLPTSSPFVDYLAVVLGWATVAGLALAIRMML